MANQSTEKYGFKFKFSEDYWIELSCIKRGGKWKDSEGKECGLGLYQHFRNFYALAWPEDAWHDWEELILRSLCENKMVGIMGPKSTGKTHGVVKYLLTNFFAYQDDFTGLVSSTDMRSLELRIWGEVKKYWRRARKRFPELPGVVLESKCAITIERLDEVEGRDLRKGIIGIPCVVNHSFVGLGKYAGIKNKFVMAVGDEMQFMSGAMLDSYSNLDGNLRFQGVAMGNPKDPTDALGKFCEPSAEVGGWEGADTKEITKTWKTRFMDGIAINLVGTDSPNMRGKIGEPPPFPFLITPQQISNTIKFYGKESLQTSMMCIGMMPKGGVSRRVITRQMCVKFKAMEEPVWGEREKKKIWYLDAAYGSIGGDRCVFGELCMGYDPEGVQILAHIGDPVIVPVSVKKNDLPEDQIAKWVKSECRKRGLEPEDGGLDSTGRGTLVGSFARIWSPNIHAVEFGGKPSDRSVSSEIKARCRDYYGKMVTELWYSVRYVIEAGQFRGLPESTMEEGCMREWGHVAGNKIDVEKKEDCKERMGRSPDLFDGLVVGVEVARRKGFVISGLASPERQKESMRWLYEMRQKQKEFHSKANLVYS